MQGPGLIDGAGRCHALAVCPRIHVVGQPQGGFQLRQQIGVHAAVPGGPFGGYVFGIVCIGHGVLLSLMSCGEFIPQTKITSRRHPRS
jgi:hypothetical protein